MCVFCKRKECCFPKQIHFFPSLFSAQYSSLSRCHCDCHCVLILSLCGARLVAAIRAVLVKGLSSGDAVYAAADETTKELKERICQLHQIQKQTANGSGTGISPARVMYNLCSPASQLQFWLLRLSSSPYIHANPTSSSLTVSWQCTDLCLCCCSSPAKGVRSQSCHCIRRSGHCEGADGSIGWRSIDSSVSEQGRAAVWGPARPQRSWGDLHPHVVQVGTNSRAIQIYFYYYRRHTHHLQFTICKQSILSNSKLILCHILQGSRKQQ